MLDLVKLALRIAGNDFDDEINNLISAALLDLGISDITPSMLEGPTDPLINLAVITYVKIHFGEPDEAERLKASYWEQKAQLLMSSNYTDYSEVE